jgi:FtsH-binding integral membrane protein
MENIQRTIKKESKEISRRIKKQMYTYIAAALGLVAGLAWNEAIKALIDYVFPLSKNTLIAKFSYAGLITLVVVLITIYLARVLEE